MRAAPVAVALVGVLLGSAVSLAPSSAAEFDAVVKANPVSLRLSTSEGMSERAVTEVINLLFEAPARPSYLIARLGSGLARGRLVTAVADGKLTGTDPRVVLSGSPFTSAERAAVTAAGFELGRMPVHAVAQSILMTGPATEPGSFGTEKLIEDGLIELGEPDLIDGPHPSAAASTFRLPWKNFAAMYLEVSEGFANWWLEPSLMAEWGFVRNDVTGTFSRPGSDFYLVGTDGYPKFSARFEPSATNLYMQQAILESAPEVWATYFRLQGVPAPTASSESFLGGQGTVWRSKGVGELLRHLADPSGQGRNILDATIRGSMTAAPLWSLGQLSDAYPAARSQRWVAKLRNGSGEWVLPTSESISRAVAAGGERPLYAIGNAAPGAYPLTWVESFYAPTTGLTIDETNALAGLVRLMVTDGQDIVRKDQDGVISAPVRATALDALNRTVTTNCQAADGVVVTTQDSPYYPSAELAPKLRALPAQAVCATKVPIATTTSTTAAPTTTTTAAPTTTSSTTPPTTARAAAVQGTTARTTPRPATTRPAVTTTPETTTAVPTTVAPTTTTTAPAIAPTDVTEPPPTIPEGDTGAIAPVRALLPFGQPDPGAGGFNRLLTMLLGGACVLWGRRAFGRRRRLA